MVKNGFKAVFHRVTDSLSAHQAQSALPAHPHFSTLKRKVL